MYYIDSNGIKENVGVVECTGWLAVIASHSDSMPAAGLPRHFHTVFG